MIKKILFFSLGDSRSATTWSNIPYLLSKTLEARGIEVVRVNLLNARLDWLYNHTIRLFLRLTLLPFGVQPMYYPYTRWEKILGERILRRAVRENPDASCCLFINYFFYNKFNNIPSILLSDWTQKLYRQRQGEKSTFLQLRCDRQEEEAVKNAEHVVTIFRTCLEEMKSLYPGANIEYLGGNVINNLYDRTLIEGANSGSDGDRFIYGNDIVKLKKTSNEILIIAKPDRYKESTQLTIKAFEKLREEYPTAELHIIGMINDDLHHLPEGVFCHGYLHKDIAEENREFYDLLLKAKVVVNVTPKWAAYSSLIEAMYFYTPIICSPFEQFVDEFGKEIDFGFYNSEYSTEGILCDFTAIMQCNNYESLCLAAHERVKDYTWDNYTDKLLKLI